MELAAFLWALGDVPVAMAGGGDIVLGPQPWLLLPAGPLQVFVGVGDPPMAGRIHILRGPWFTWVDLPPPRLALGRAIGPAWLALVRGLGDLQLAWEVMASSHLALFGSLGHENACGLRFRWTRLWAAALIRQGGLTLWCGAYF
ncbi:hypothetical protein H5T54_07020 [Candidatus Bipolaricaulota bacterium]|nr:hypothetical protein [Candidatus Bipolaricaulota bacterium]